ncbi:MAG: hypothetical protein Kow0069_17230 [Promethearchaeota archaeon]
MFATHALAGKRQVVVYILLLWASLLPVVLAGAYVFTPYLSNRVGDWKSLALVPVHAFWLWGLWTLSALLVSRAAWGLARRAHPPREGVFPRDRNDPDYRAWTWRATCKKLGFWAAHVFPLPWLEYFAYRWFGGRGKGGGAFYDCTVDPEFLDLGEDARLGVGCIVTPSMVMGDKLVIAKIRVGARSVIGARARLAPGTVVGDDVVLSALSVTEIGQHLESGYMYAGVPAQKFRKNELVVDGHSP